MAKKAHRADAIDKVFFIRTIREVSADIVTEKRWSSFFDAFYEDHGHDQAISEALLWKEASKLLEDVKHQCSQCYCTSCYRSSHKHGRRRHHHWVGFSPGCRMCQQCENAPAEKVCAGCEGKEFCSRCFSSYHKSGGKAYHTYAFLWENASSVSETKSLNIPYCHHCKRRLGTHTCRVCGQKSCNSCHDIHHLRVCLAFQEEDAGKNGRSMGSLNDLGSSYAKDKRDTEALGLIPCTVCGKEADTFCESCGDAYCSVTWMGNPGCFVKLHR
jgi:hypothetical protein